MAKGGRGCLEWVGAGKHGLGVLEGEEERRKNKSREEKKWEETSRRIMQTGGSQ